MGRWHAVDPAIEEHYEWSPYVYVYNNPIWLIDPDGRDTVPSFADGWNKHVREFNNNINSAINARIDDPSLILNDIGEMADNLLTTAADITGISNLVGVENNTANSVGDLANTISQIPNMSAEEQGAFAAAVSIFVSKVVIEKKIPAGKLPGKNTTKVFSTRKIAKDARPKPKPAKKGAKQVTRQSKNKNGEGNKMKTDGGNQTPHFHDANHSNKNKTNVHYRVGTKKYKTN